jgi:hypothetical protein
MLQTSIAAIARIAINNTSFFSSSFVFTTTENLDTGNSLSFYKMVRFGTENFSAC